VTQAAITASEWTGRARALESEGWNLMDLCGIDWLGVAKRRPRLEIVVQLLRTDSKERTTLHVSADGDPPTIPSVSAIWPTANFMEREAFDMFGIMFEGHPDLKRILMPDEWEGYPLRKDYGVGKVPVEFTPQPFLQVDAPGQRPRSEDAGVAVDRLGQAQGIETRKWGQKQ
jgi:NADH:ubiquinone oxidoreductase subunit C